MIRSEKIAIIKENIQIVWDKITDNQKYSWRSDLSKIEIIDDKHFIEYDKSNFPTEFCITKKEENTRYEFDIKNKNLKGHFTAILQPIQEKETQITLVEEIEVDNVMMRLLAKGYLKKQQEKYVQDLEKSIQK